MAKKRSYCKGLMCRECDRKHKSYISGIYMCSQCAVQTDKGFITIDEFVECTDKYAKKKMREINKSFEIIDNLIPTPVGDINRVDS